MNFIFKMFIFTRIFSFIFLRSHIILLSKVLLLSSKCHFKQYLQVPENIPTWRKLLAVSVILLWNCDWDLPSFFNLKVLNGVLIEFMRQLTCKAFKNSWLILFYINNNFKTLLWHENCSFTQYYYPLSKAVPFGSSMTCRWAQDIFFIAQYWFWTSIL